MRQRLSAYAETGVDAQNFMRLNFVCFGGALDAHEVLCPETPGQAGAAMGALPLFACAESLISANDKQAGNGAEFEKELWRG